MPERRKQTAYVPARFLRAAASCGGQKAGWHGRFV